MTTGRECYHCKQWIEPGETHDCGTTTEAALTQDLSEELRDAWHRLREAAMTGVTSGTKRSRLVSKATAALPNQLQHRPGRCRYI